MLPRANKSRKDKDGKRQNLNKTNIVSSGFRRKNWGWSNNGFKRSTKAGAVPNVKLFNHFLPKVIANDIEPPLSEYTKTIQTEENIDDKRNEEQAVHVETSTVQDDYSEIGVAPLDGDEPQVYSEEIAIPPFSFYDPGLKYNK